MWQMGAEVKTIQALELPRPKEELEFCIKTLLALLGVRNFVLEYFFLVQQIFESDKGANEAEINTACQRIVKSCEQAFACLKVRVQGG